MARAVKDHMAGKARWRNPFTQKPPGGTKINLLTEGWIQTTGYWADDCGYIAWAPLIAVEEEDMGWIRENMERARAKRLSKRSQSPQQALPCSLSESCASGADGMTGNSLLPSVLDFLPDGLGADLCSA